MNRLRVRLFFILIVAFGGTSGLSQDQTQRPARIVIAVKAGYLLDVNRGRLEKDVVILIRNDRIDAVGKLGKLQIPKNAEVIDLSNATVMPGMIDAHTHLAWSAPQKPDEIVGAEDALRTLMAGFTSVRNLGSTKSADIVLRDAINSGRVVGPRMQVAGAPLGRKGGVCDRVFAGEGVADGITAAQSRVRQLVSAGADVIKLCAGGGVLLTPGEDSAVEYSEAEIRAIANEAHGLGRKVGAHANGIQAIRNAVLAGVDSIEHGGFMDEASAKLMRRRKVYLVPTIFRYTWLLEDSLKNGASESDIKKLKTTREIADANVRLAIAVGTPIAMGTDATVFPHGLNARELEAYVRLGMSPLQAIRASTLNAADLMGWPVGRVKPGNFADLIAVEGNPLQDISVLRKVRFVMKGGKVFRNEFESH